MKKSETAILWMGYQKDFFAENGKLKGWLDIDSETLLNQSLDLIKKLEGEVLMISCPLIVDSKNQAISAFLKAIVAKEALRENTEGAALIDSFETSASIIKSNFHTAANALESLELQKLLKENHVKNLVLAGVPASLNVDATAKAAFAMGWNTYILTDCLAFRTQNERTYFSEALFPLYSNLIDTELLLSRLED